MSFLKNIFGKKQQSTELKKLPQITAKLVKELSEMTGAKIGDSKNALIKAKGDMTKAIEILRKKGEVSVAKDSYRSANELLQVEYQDFASQWANIISSKDPVAMFTFNLNVKVRCRNCNEIVNGEDTVRGAELYCPKCGAGWVVWKK